MGLMEQPNTEPGRLVVTPHPLLVDGQRNVAWELRAGESLYALLMRNVPELDGQRWEVTIGGRAVERHLWHHLRPKHGQVIEVRGGLGRAALQFVAIAVLAYFTMGAGAGWIASTFGVSAGAATAIGAGMFMAGSMLINKVLAPKVPKPDNRQADTVYSISAARNQMRLYEPLPLLFGRVRITPDLLSKPYTWYEGNDQYLGMLLCAGINVGRIEQLYNGETLLSSYDGVQVFHAGYSQMPEQAIPLYSNADTVDGADLPKDGSWIVRTTATNTMRVQVNLEYILGGTGTSGKAYTVLESVEVQYRAKGTTAWTQLAYQAFRSDRFDVRRATIARDVPVGQYEVRVRMFGQGNYEGKNTQKNDFQWTTMTSVRPDGADYTGISRSGVRIKATGQLSGALDEVRGLAVADPIPEWNGSEWVTKESSNPGAQCVAYARGMRRHGRLLGGMNMTDAQIDLESWKAFTLHCAANGYTYDFEHKQAKSHSEILSSIARAGFGEITLAGGRLGVTWAAQDQPLSGVVNMATIKKGQFQVDYSLVSAADGIEFTYLDPSDWQPRTLRVPAPGVGTMLNPAQVTGEGVTSEQHAARMARWHLAQSLYQYKDISYSTDIEHLSYQRLSVLALQHDMTQWGFGGRVRSAQRNGSAVTLTLDEPVPARAGASAYIGLRIPGERVYRVLRVRTFTGESDVLTLADPWPADAPLPGDREENPAHDTIWIYDFKQTPGYRVRVTSIEPEADLKGAAVRVVPEGPEFWTYVLTGHYIPPPNGSSLQTRPVASNLRITEHQVTQGNTVFTELTATFDVTGPVGNVLVRAAGLDGELQDVAQTTTRTATWRIPGPGRYTVVVRPFSPTGEPGVAVQAVFTTTGAGLPPALVDLFSVDERSGGVRLYTWGWMEDTMRSADFAGVEIRYTKGRVQAPNWDAMTPVGQTGYHTAPFEAVVPESGDWTFACRSVNTSGELSTDARIVIKTLGQNLGQVIDRTVQELIDAQRRIDQEKVDRFKADAEVAQQAAADATAKANAAKAEAIAHADAMGAIVADITEADEWKPDRDYPAGDFVRHGGKLYRALRDSKGKQPGVAIADWQLVGNFSGIGEALAASIDMAYQNASDLEVEAGRISAIVARMPDGDGKVASTQALDQVSGRVEETEKGLRAVGERSSSMEAQLHSRTTGGRDWYTGDRNVYAGNRTWMSVIAEGDRAIGKRVDSTNVELGQFKADATRSVEALATEQKAQSEVIEHVGAELEGKASADAVRQVTSRVEETEKGLLSVSGDLSSVKVDLDGKASSQALLGIEARVEEAEDGITKVLARAFLNVIADAGLGPVIGGMEISNDGKVVATRFLSHLFEIISPDAGSGLEFRNGYIRTWNGNAQRIIGNGFGIVGESLIDYFGPNVGAGNASKANATMWMDSSGGAYWGGALAAGLLRNAVQTTTVQTIGTNLVCGPFDTNGRNKSVVVSFARTHLRVRSASTATGFVAGAGENTATVNIYRQVGNTAEVLWHTLVARGSVSIMNEPDGPDRATSYWSGSVTLNDGADGSQRRQYRAEIVGFTEQAVRHEEGNFNSQTITQNLSIVSVEI